MRNILIYRDHLLPISETFILQQSNALTSFVPNLTGLRRAVNSLDVGANAVVLTESHSLAALLIDRAYRISRFAPSFHRKLKRLHPLLIHSHFATDGVNAVHLSKLLKIPLVVTLHGYDVTVKRDYKALCQGLWEQASAFICVSEFIRRQAIQAGFPEHKLRVHYIGINTKTFQPVGEWMPNRLLFIGRLVEKKGCEVLLRAVEKVQREFPAVHLVIAGDGPLRGNLEALAGVLKVSCEFLGSVSSDRVKELISQSSILCVPSVTANNGDSEGLPTVVLEAMAMRVPVVGTIHAGIPEAIEHNVTGLLAEENDIHQLAGNIIRFLGDNNLRESCARLALARVKQDFDLKVQTGKLEHLYDEILRVGHP